MKARTFCTQTRAMRPSGTIRNPGSVCFLRRRCKLSGNEFWVFLRIARIHERFPTLDSHRFLGLNCGGRDYGDWTQPWFLTLIKAKTLNSSFEWL
jgi:hypothetical protein